MTLPGMGGALLGFATPGTLQFSFVDFASASSNTISLPSGAAAGDIAVLFDGGFDGGGSSIASVVPTGWTSTANTFYDYGGDSVRITTSYKLLTAGDIGKVITGINTGREVKIVTVFRPNKTIVTTTASTWNSQLNGVNPTLQTVSASGQPAPLIVFAFAMSRYSAATFTTETPAMTNLSLVGGSTGSRIGYTIYNSSPADQSIDTSNDGLQSGYLRFT